MIGPAKSSAPDTDYRPWGYYTVLADELDHKVKRICDYEGRRLSIHRHHRRAEHWYIVAGTATVTVDGVDVTITRGGAIDIPRGSLHRIMNAGNALLPFIEVQTGDYFGEDDIERLEDDYGRIS